MTLSALLPVHSSVALWGLSKKRPLALQREAHGLRGEQGLEQPFWVSSVAALLNTDLIATGGCLVRQRGGGSHGGGLVRGCSLFPCIPGSHNNSVRLWQCGEGFRQLDLLCDIPLVSEVWIPSLSLLHSPRSLAVFLPEGQLLRAGPTMTSFCSLSS